MKVLTTIDLNGTGKVVNSADPTGGQDLVTKSYVDSVASGLRDWKESVRVATTAALPTNTRAGGVLTASANGALTVDGVTVGIGDRVLVKNEATGANNGIYTVTATGSGSAAWALTRATDADANAEVTSGLATFVTEGTVNGGTAWVLTTHDPITVNTTSLAFTQFGGGTLYSAGNGLNLSGTVFSAVADVGIVVTSSGIKVDTSVVARKYTALIGNGSATSIAVSHNLSNQYATVQLFDASTNSQVFADVVLTDANTTTVTFTTAPATNSIRIVVTA